jgi:hypothetical protein
MKTCATFFCLIFLCSAAFAQTEISQSMVDDLKKEIAAKDQKIEELTNEIETLKSAPLQQSAIKKGVVFKVQIGTFKNKDLSKYFENNKNFSGEVDEDGAKKYTLGQFSDYWEADNFKKYLREMGVKDAWVVAYKDKKRLNMKDVLEGNIK